MEAIAVGPDTQVRVYGVSLQILGQSRSGPTLLSVFSAAEPSPVEQLAILRDFFARCTAVLDDAWHDACQDESLKKEI